MKFFGSILLSIVLVPVVLAADPTPFNCDTVSIHMRGTCARIEAQLVQQEARQRGRPVPTKAVLKLPAHGSAKAKEWGFACISGVSMRRLRNGWEQLRTRDHEHIRCEDL